MQIIKHVMKPPRIIVYGDAGIGKTTFAAHAPSPVFIGTEDGLGSIEADCFDGITDFNSVIQALSHLGREEHQYKTVVIDSLDWLEPLIWDATCQRLKVPSIETPGYGRGYIEAQEEWRTILQYLTALRDHRGMMVIMIAHTNITRIEDPLHPAYDKYMLKLNKRAAALCSEDADIIGFATLDTYTTSEKASGFVDKDERRSRVISTDTRVLRLQPSGAYIAKNRYGMPTSVPLVWSEFEKHLPGRE